MNRYYFNFSSKQEKIEDQRGVDLDSIATAHSHAVALVRRTMATFSDDLLRDWRIEITDDRGTVLLTVLFFPIPPRCKPFGERGESGVMGAAKRNTARRGLRLPEGER
jgi:hypothetical protein